MSEWFREENFWRRFGKCMFHPKSFSAAAAEVADILACAADDVARVLDLGCGPGRHAVPLAGTGVAVTGVDLSRHLLDLGQAYAKREQVQVDWVQADMRGFHAAGRFDLIISMWTSFGYFEDPADDREVLARCHENLRPGGTLLLDVVGKEYLARNIEPVHLTELENGSLLIERPLLEDDLCRVSNEWLLIEGERVHRAQWHHNVYSGRELADLVTAAGFSKVRIQGNLRGAAYDLDAERLVLVATRA